MLFFLSETITALFFVGIIYITYWWSKKRNYWKEKGVPSKPKFPLLQMKEWLFPEKGIPELIHDLYKSFEGEKFGGVFRFGTPSFLVRDLELINQILIKDFIHFEDRGPPIENNDLMGLSLFNLSGDKWRNARHKMTPTFTSGKLKMMFGLMKECSDELIAYLDEKQEEDVDGKDVMRKCVFNIIGKVAFGLDVGLLKEKDAKKDEFLNNATKFFRPSAISLMKMLLNMAYPKIFKLKVISEEVDNFFQNMVRDVIKYRETSEQKRNDFIEIVLNEKRKEEADFRDGQMQYALDRTEVSESEDKELLDQLKNMENASYLSSSKYKKIFTEEFIAAQSFVFISGGSESTATVLSYIIYELSVNQDVQNKLANEIIDVISLYGFTYEAITKMTYLEQCINELLRLHPVVFELNRICTRDYKIPDTDIVLSKGTLIQIPVIGLHKDSQYFPDPEKFDPDRFADMNNIPRGAYFPFGGGPRFCIAMRLALIELKVILAALLSNYSVNLSKRTKLPLKIKKFSFFGEIEGGLWFVINKRKKD